MVLQLLQSERQSADARSREPSSEDSDSELASRARSGDRRAFELLWQRHERLVRAILVRLAPRRELDDLAQDVATSALQSIDRLSQVDRFVAWLGSIARNRARDALGEQGRRPFIVSVDTVEEPRARLDSALGIDDEFVRGAIAELPDSYRTPLGLRVLLGCSSREIADRTGLTIGSVRVNLCRGMKLLRALLLARSA